MIRCLTVRQPWASAIFLCGKDVENRTGTTNYRGPLAIHAGKMVEWDWVERLKLTEPLPTGAVIGTVDL